LRIRGARGRHARVAWCRRAADWWLACAAQPSRCSAGRILREVVGANAVD